MMPAAPPPERKAAKSGGLISPASLKCMNSCLFYYLPQNNSNGLQNEIRWPPREEIGLVPDRKVPNRSLPVQASALTLAFRNMNYAD